MGISHLFLSISKVFFFFKFILRERDRGRESEHVRAQGRGREKGRERILNRPLAASPEPDMGLNPSNHEIVA